LWISEHTSQGGLVVVGQRLLELPLGVPDEAPVSTRLTTVRIESEGLVVLLQSLVVLALGAPDPPPAGESKGIPGIETDGLVIVG
jgi:hypothetical protein